MKNKSFASIKLIIYNFLVPFTVLCLPIMYAAFMIILGKLNYIFVMVLIALYVFLWFMLFCLLCHNAYQTVKIDCDGIHNSNISLKWNDITHIKLLDVELFKYTFPKSLVIDDIMVIGDRNLGDSFASQNTKQCIILSLTKQNKLLLNKYCQNDMVLSLI